jgi:hypothetical protein
MRAMGGRLDTAEAQPERDYDLVHRRATADGPLPSASRLPSLGTAWLVVSPPRAGKHASGKPRTPDRSETAPCMSALATSMCRWSVSTI